MRPDGGVRRERGVGAERVLVLAAAALALAILAGTALGLATGSRQRKLGREAAWARAAEAGADAYLSLGAIRARSADPKPAVVVATVAFPFDRSDRAFAEELERKEPALRAAAAACLSRRKAAELGPAFEGAVKAALRDALNGLLSLGKVEELWLSDFAVIQ